MSNNNDDNDDDKNNAVEDEDCTMWTLGSFCDPRLTPYDVFERTDVMAGPSHTTANITKMIVDLDLGDGQFQEFDDAASARNYMLNSMMERFAFGAASNGVVGHMVNAYRVGDELEFYDFQVPPHHGTPTRPPEGPGWVYTIFPINDGD